MMEGPTGHRTSHGSLSNFQRESLMSPEGHGQEAEQRSSHSGDLHADGAGPRPNGEDGRMHATGPSAHRPEPCGEAMGEVGPLGMYRGAPAHGRPGSRFPYQCGHGPCNARISGGAACVGGRPDAGWAGRARPPPMRAKAYEENGPDVKSPHRSRVHDKCVGPAGPVMKACDKGPKGTDVQAPGLRTGRAQASVPQTYRTARPTL